jgi:hypothetical protein
MPTSNKQDVNLPFPINGIFESRPYDQQPERTTTDAKNVLSFDVGEDRQRGGRRLGIKKTTPENTASSRFDGRVQLLDITAVPGSDGTGYPAGTSAYNNSSDDGVADFTPANLTVLSSDPNQDGNTDDAMGTESPAQVVDNTVFPIPMNECSKVTPDPGSADTWDDNGYNQADTGHTTLPLVPHVQSGSLGSNHNATSALWHTRTVDGKDGCIYPRAPFNKLDHDEDEGDEDYRVDFKKLNQMPSAFIASSFDDIPLQWVGGGINHKPTMRTYASSVLFPFQSDSENPFHSGESKVWAATCSIRTPAGDAWGTAQGGNKSSATYATNNTKDSGTGKPVAYKLEGNASPNREYYYGMVFRVRAAVTEAGTTIDATEEDKELLFVGFHQESDGDGDPNNPSKQPRLKIGTIQSVADQVNLVDSRTLTMPGATNDTGKHRTWYDLDVRCHDGKIRIYLDGAGPVKDENENTVFDLEEDFLGANTDGATLDLMRARSGLLFWCSSSVNPRNFEITGLESTDNVDFWDCIQCFADNSSTPITTETFGSTETFEVSISSSYSSDTGNENQEVEVDAWKDTGSASVQERDIYFRDSSQSLGDGENNDGKFASSYPDEYGSTTGKFHGAEGLWNDRSNWVHWAYVSDIMYRAEWGGDFVRDWNEPYFHNFCWRALDDNMETTRAVVGVGNGIVKISSNGGDSFSDLTQEVHDPVATTDLDFSTVVSRVAGIEFYSNYYMTDGTKYIVLDLQNRELKDWSRLSAAESGDDNESDVENYSIPGGPNFDTDTAKCPLISQHMGRIVLAGLPSFPNNWFMSAIYTDSVDYGQGPNNWDTGGDDTLGEAAPVSGTSTSLSEIGEPIRALFPFREDSMVFGCRNSIYVLTGDPGFGTSSSITGISRDIGIVGPDAWTYGPNRSLYFFGSNGLYSLRPNEFNVDQSNRISTGRLDREFASIDLSKYNIRLVYDYFLYGIHVFLSSFEVPTGPVRHYFYDERSQALWPMEYPGTQGPSASVYYSHSEPDRRRVLLGGYDGHVRFFDGNTGNDDGTAIDSHVWIGPFQIGPITEAKVMRMAAVLDAQSPNVNWGIYVGDTAEEAQSSTAIATGTWSKGRNLWKHVRARGQNIFVKLYQNSDTDTSWSLENITATLAVAGRVRERN